MHRYLPAFIVFLFFIAVCASAQEDYDGNVIVHVEGRAAINPNDIAGSRNDALHSALRDAVLHAAAQVLSVDINDKGLDAVRKLLNEQQDKYIKSYRITAERSQHEFYLINVSVTVKFSALASDLKKTGIFHQAKIETYSAIVSLKVYGLKKYSDLLQLKEFLKNKTRIVKNIYPRAFQWQEAEFDVEITGTARLLADELTRAGFYILDAKQIDKNQLKITFLQKGGE